MDKKILTTLSEIKEELGHVRAAMVTKSDLPKFREEITEDISEIMTELLELMDERKADKTQVNLIDARVRQIETKLIA